MDSKLSTVTLTAPAASQHVTCRYLKTPLRNSDFETTQTNFESQEETIKKEKISKQKWPLILQLAAWEVSSKQYSFRVRCCYRSTLEYRVTFFELDTTKSKMCVDAYTRRLRSIFIPNLAIALTQSAYCDIGGQSIPMYNFSVERDYNNNRSWRQTHRFAILLLSFIVYDRQHVYWNRSKNHGNNCKTNLCRWKKPWKRIRQTAIKTKARQFTFALFGKGPANFPDRSNGRFLMIWWFQLIIFMYYGSNGSANPPKIFQKSVDSEICIIVQTHRSYVSRLFRISYSEIWTGLLKSRPAN